MSIYNLGRVLPIFKGEYDPTETYENLDVVLYNGSSYVALNTTTNNLPTDENHWVLVALAGTLSPEQIAEVEQQVIEYVQSQGYVIDADYVHTDNNYSNTDKNKLEGIDMTTKQDTLVSGTNIKSINNQSILGSGNIDIEGVSDYEELTNKPSINGTTLVGDTTITIPTKTSDLINDSGFATTSDVNSAVSGKQDTLISGSNIKTVNNESLLGSGNITIESTNHFKGWFDNLTSLQTQYSSPVVGDYGYVKGATTTDPVKIYECNSNGTWSDSGREVDTSNVQSFETGQAVNEVGIDNEPAAGSDNLVKSGGVEKYLAHYVSDFTTGGGVGNTAMAITDGVVSPSSPAGGYRSYGLNNLPAPCHLKAGYTVTLNTYAPTSVSVISKIITDGSNTTYECLLQGRGGTQDYTYTVTEDVDVVICTNGSRSVHIEGLEEAAPKSVEENVTNLSSNISSVTSRVTTLESNVTTLDTKVTNLETKANLGTLVYKRMYHHLNVESIYQIIPSQSLFDIAYAKALGFRIIEANPHMCSDGVYVTKHGGSGGTLGNGLTFASGSSINSNTLFSEVTSTQLRTDVTYNSPVAKYRGYIPTVTEFCKECARLDMIPFLRACTTEILAEARKYLSDDHIIIEGLVRRGDFKGLMMRWSSETNPTSILNICNIMGKPFLFGWLGQQDDITIPQVAQMLHENGYLFGAGYLTQNSYQNALVKGFDAVGSTFHQINPFEIGNKLNILRGDDSNLQLTNATYDSSADVLNMNQNGTITVESQEIGSSLAKICVKLRYSGNISVAFARAYYSNDNLDTFQSDGSNEIVMAVALEKVGNRILQITANEDTVIYDIKVFVSMV